MTEPISSFVFVPLQEFASVEEPGAHPLATASDGGSVIPADGTVLVYGDGGAGKTTLTIDIAFALASGESWLGIMQPQRPVRILMIENEGPRGEFRRKLDRKLAHHGADGIEDRITVLEEPWAAFSFADESHRAALTIGITEHHADLLIVGPLASVGMVGGGTPDEIRAFEQHLSDLRRRVREPLAIQLVHHTNKSGDVSGAWDRVPDTLIHLTAQGHGRTRISWKKARHSSALHGTTTQLVWADGDSYTVEDKPQVTDDTIAEGILAAALQQPGASWTQIRELKADGVKLVRGHAEQVAAVRDRLLNEGLLINTAAVEGRFTLYHHTGT